MTGYLQTLLKVPRRIARRFLNNLPIMLDIRTAKTLFANVRLRLKVCFVPDSALPAGA
jgi:hypothetical protein